MTARSRSSVGAVAAYAAIALVSAVAGYGAVYATAFAVDNVGGHARAGVVSAAPASETGARPVAPPPSGAIAQLQAAPGADAPPLATGRNPLATGEMATFVFRSEPQALPEVRFTDESGRELSLADWKGRVVLLNIWATWCAPCRKEMPQLERLQKELGSDRFEVVALSVDRGGVAASKRFLDQIKVEALKPYTDPTARAGAQLKAIGMPTTLLIDREGREIGRLVGPAEWDSEDAKRLIKAQL